MNGTAFLWSIGPEIVRVVGEAADIPVALMKAKIIL